MISSSSKQCHLANHLIEALTIKCCSVRHSPDAPRNQLAFCGAEHLIQLTVRAQRPHSYVTRIPGTAEPAPTTEPNGHRVVSQNPRMGFGQSWVVCPCLTLGVAVREGLRSAIWDLGGVTASCRRLTKTVRTAQSRPGFLQRGLPSSDRNQPTPDSQCNRFGSGGRA
jgi:hypothetical protein